MRKEACSMNNETVWIDLFILIGYILGIVACWRIFSDHGEKGWKALIPVYSAYILFKLFYQTKQFWYHTVAMTGFSASNMFFVPAMVTGLLEGNFPTYTWISALVMMASLIWAIIIQWRLYRSLASSYGKGTVFTIGLLLYTGLFEFILAFSNKDNMSYEKTANRNLETIAVDQAISDTSQSNNKNIQAEVEIVPKDGAEKRVKPKLPTEDIDKI